MKKYFAIFITTYTILLLYMMFYGSGREASEIGYIQIKPFHTIHLFFSGNHISSKDFIINIIGNIFLFSPFGWLGLTLKKFNHILPITLFFIVAITAIEITQYYSGRGVADIDDVLLNTLGMAIGFVLFKYVKWINLGNIKLHLDLVEEKYKLQKAS
ncbi:VanZ family protein [Chryseobacterium polytrichastri]|uniref:VanZ like family protein n=1 Tax=Chryseobacterium polytrichastri TaxID=1302687 RepID=A0A1M7HS52_9FLAO|nr:VanZ family protein [Chryseobacterium polytrichastri]SHM31238.1 VanZ like family protein [Chryseobacterium polytrichastri]